MIALITLIFVIIAVEAITEIIVASDIFTELRGWFSRQAALQVEEQEPLLDEDPVKPTWIPNWIVSFISRLITCGYCCSVWVAGALAWCIPLSLTGYWYMDIIIKWYTVHRMANWFHEFMARWLNRHPWTCVLHKVGNDNDQKGS